MLVIIANDLPPAVRGLLKVWCIEPKPHVFITDLNERIEEKITAFLSPYFKDSTGLLVIKSDKRLIQGFVIYNKALPEKKMVTISGLQLIEEKSPTEKKN
jgi:CRISPR-associated endoribonuclease Cas2, subtype I-E/ECOLI